MPKYFTYKVSSYYLYFTSFCVIEAMHVHANKDNTKEFGSTKLWVHSDGSTSVAEYGRNMTQKSLLEIQAFIKQYYIEMYETWVNSGGTPEFRNK